MCGIAGIINFNSSELIIEEQIKAITGSLVHRGPDDCGFYINQNKTISLGHRRLSIIDLFVGHQPMANYKENIWIVFNGEIYNYKELKNELQKKGYKFKTNSDTEVIINFYEAYGDRDFYRLNGIFAFAIFDSRNNSVILARDHFGVKPLYYTIINDTLIFGSEIKAILNVPSVKRELDFEAFNSFLTYRYNPAPQTLFKGIRKLEAGHVLKFSDDNSVRIESFWNYKPHINLNITFSDAVNEYQSLLETAVKRQMISDVPVGLLLSGGIDSAIIGHLMKEFSNEKIKTFTIGFEGEGDYNELNDAKETANFIESEHYDLTISKKEYLDFFFNSFNYIEEPIAETTIPALYYVSKLASKYVKVVLAGQGADEPLAGYQRYFGEQMLSKYFTLLNLLPIKTIAKILPRNERFKQAAYALNFSNELERFLAIYTIFTPTQKQLLLNQDTFAKLKNNDLNLIEQYYDKSKQLIDSLSKILFIDSRMHLPDDLLLFGDKMSMANSLEMRVPFLDIELMKFLESLPSNFKLKGRTHKYIHKKALKKWLPDEIIYRKKRPFATPMDEWLQGDFVNDIIKIFNSKDSASREFFNLDYINEMIKAHKNRKQNYRKQLFALLSFELWYKNFFNKN